MKHFFLALFLFFGCLHAKDKIDALYLTFGEDPTTTMVVTWHGSKDQKVLHIKEGKSWKTLEAKTSQLASSNVYVHRVYIDGLTPGASQRFKVAGDTEELFFKTLPKTLSRDIKFAVGGDTYRFLYLFREIGKQIAETDPDFVVVGGDIAYTKGTTTLFTDKDWELKRWATFFKEWKTHMRAPDGRLIPMVVVVGNHDVKTPRTDFFFDLFYYPRDRQAFTSYEFGDYLQLMVLDSGHASPIKGEQAAWLEKTLKSRKDIAAKIAVYHVGAYPSVYPYESSKPREIRDAWVPIFEENGVKLCFEHHNHAYKRTFALKQGKIDPQGVVYMGDGAWGVEPREPKKRWYLANAQAVNHFFLVTLTDKKVARVEARGLDDSKIDEVQTIAFEPVEAHLK